MRHVFLALLTSAAAVSFVGLFHLAGATLDPRRQATPPITRTTADADRLLHRQPGYFVPNLGQWEHPARYVHRSGAMTLFVENRGWMLALEEPRKRSAADARVWRKRAGESRKLRGIGLRMTFAGAARVPGIVGEEEIGGHHNYFLGNDENRWRVGVPLYRSIRYKDLYPGVDLRLREANGCPEYDLLLEPGTDLSQVVVDVEGAQGLSIASDGSLVIETALGPVTQSVPETWQVGSSGEKHRVRCDFTLLADDRFGFEAPSWSGDASLTIDPVLHWSTFLGGKNWDSASAVCVDASGVVTVAGETSSPDFPTKRGAYDTIRSPSAFVTRMDPRQTGSAQLVYSTFLGGDCGAHASALSVDARGVATVAGTTGSGDFPTTPGAFNTTYNGGSYGGCLEDAFITRLDPDRTGKAQLVYSTYLGAKDSYEWVNALSVDIHGVVTVTGGIEPDFGTPNFPTTSGAYDSTYNGPGSDVFISRLDPRKSGRAQLVYSTFLGAGTAAGLAVDGSGTVTVAGSTGSTRFPTTIGAYDTTFNGATDVFVGRLDPRKLGAAQLVYGTYLGGSDYDSAIGIAVHADGVATLAGSTGSTGFPTTSGAWDTTYNGGSSDSFVSRLDPSKTGTAQLIYSTFFGGSHNDIPRALSVDASGAVSLAGWTYSANFPTTGDAFDTTYNGRGDGFVCRLDPDEAGVSQLVYSTYLGGSDFDGPLSLVVDASGVVTVAGQTESADFPWTRGAFDTSHNGGGTHRLADAFVSRLAMGVALYGDVHEVSIATGGTQQLTVNAGKAHKSLRYWIFGSETGTTPGIDLMGVHVPLNPDMYTVIAMGAVNGKEFTSFRGTLDADGRASASFNLPAKLALPPGFACHHAYVVYDAQGKLYMASNAVPLRLVN